MQAPIVTFRDAAASASSALVQVEASEVWENVRYHKPAPRPCLHISAPTHKSSDPCQCMDASASNQACTYSRSY